MKRYLALIALSLAIAPDALASSASGTLRICRPARFTAQLDKQAVTVPAGSHFVQDTGGPDGRVGSVLVTTEAVKIAPKPSGAIVPAAIEDGAALALPRGSQLLNQFSIPGAEFQARIAGGFTPR